MAGNIVKECGERIQPEQIDFGRLILEEFGWRLEARDTYDNILSVKLSPYMISTPRSQGPLIWLTVNNIVCSAALVYWLLFK
jgi:hypothetical protein